MTRCKLGSVLFVRVLPLHEWERVVFILYHVLDLDATQERCHENEIDQEQWPVDFNISSLETAQEAADRRRRHHLPPEVHFIHLTLKAFEFIILTGREGEISILRRHTKLFRVFSRRQVKHDIIDVKETQQVCQYRVTLLNVHAKKEE